MSGLIIGVLWILLSVIVLGGLWLAVLWILRKFVSGDIPQAADKFGIAVIAILGLVWLVELLFLGGSYPHFTVLR